MLMDVQVRIADFHVCFQNLFTHFSRDPWLLDLTIAANTKPLSYFVPIQTHKPFLVCRRFHEDVLLTYRGFDTDLSRIL